MLSSLLQPSVRGEHGLRQKISVHSEIKVEIVHKVFQIALGWIEQAGADNIPVIIILFDARCLYG